MSDWVNWQQFAAANRPQAQAQAEAAETERQRQQAEADRLVGRMRQEQSTALGAEGRGGPKFGGVQTLASYSDAMKAQQQATQQAQQRAAGAAPWESALGGGDVNTASPWDELGRRIGGIQADADSLRASRQVNRSMADEAKKAQTEREKKDAERKQAFYGSAATSLGSQHLESDDRRRQAQMLFYANQGGQWQAPSNVSMGSLWEQGWGSSPFKTSTFGEKPDDYDASKAPAKPAGWGGW